MWTLTLTRTYTPLLTAGVLRVRDEGERERFAAVVLELPWGGNAVRTSCIPEGAYEVLHHVSPTKGACLSVPSVPGRSAILIHAGNTVSDTAGCLVVGRYWGEIGGSRAVLESVSTLNDLMNVLPRGERHRLVVTTAVAVAPVAGVLGLVAAVGAGAWWAGRRTSSR